MALVWASMTFRNLRMLYLVAVILGMAAEEGAMLLTWWSIPHLGAIESNPVVAPLVGSLWLMQLFVLKTWGLEYAVLGAVVYVRKWGPWGFLMLGIMAVVLTEMAVFDYTGDLLTTLNAMGWALP